MVEEAEDKTVEVRAKKVKRNISVEGVPDPAGAISHPPCPTEDVIMVHGFTMGITLSSCSVLDITMPNATRLHFRRHSPSLVCFGNLSTSLLGFRHTSSTPGVALPPCSALDILWSPCSVSDVAFPPCFAVYVIPLLLHC